MNECRSITSTLCKHVGSKTCLGAESRSRQSCGPWDFHNYKAMLMSDAALPKLKLSSCLAGKTNRYKQHSQSIRWVEFQENKTNPGFEKPIEENFTRQFVHTSLDTILFAIGQYDQFWGIPAFRALLTFTCPSTRAGTFHRVHIVHVRMQPTLQTGSIQARQTRVRKTLIRLF